MRKAWDDMTHADHFCHEASFGSGTVGNVIIFSHGSGSLVVANALNNNRCQFSGSTRWYSAMVRRGHWRDSWAVPVVWARTAVLCLPVQRQTVCCSAPPPKAPWWGATAANQALEKVCPYYDTMSDLLRELDFCKGSHHDRLHNSITTIVRWAGSLAGHATCARGLLRRAPGCLSTPHSPGVCFTRCSIGCRNGTT